MLVDCISTHQLTRSDRVEMFNLLDRHFYGVDPFVFARDLAEKSHALILRDPASQNLKGFSTLVSYPTIFQGETLHIIFSGDTIVDPSAWSSPILAKAWIGAIRSLHRQSSQQKVYWFLISSGFRTYRFLSTFSRHFYPCFDQPTPPFMQALMDHLAIERFGPLYDPEHGVVRLAQPHALREHLAGVPETRQHDPHIHFFEQINPSHAQGDELVCLAEFSEANLTRAGQRIWSTAPHFEVTIESNLSLVS